MTRFGCLRGEPLPACRSFWVVEMQAHTPFMQTSREVVQPDGRSERVEAFEGALEWNLGHMVNLTPALALGGVFAVGSGRSDPLLGLKVRARRWLTHETSVELEGGLLGVDERDSRGTGVTTSARVNIRDRGSLYARWDVVPLPADEGPGSSRSDPGGVQQAFSAGIGAGRLPAVIGRPSSG